MNFLCKNYKKKTIDVQFWIKINIKKLKSGKIRFYSHNIQNVKKKKKTIDNQFIIKIKITKNKYEKEFMIILF